MLDLGPACGSNIGFLAEQVRTLYLWDLLAAWDRLRGRGLPFAKLWEDLQVPVESVDGILFWDLIDHLDDGELASLIATGRTLLRPRGMVLLLAGDRQSSSETPQAFVLREGFELMRRPRPQLSFPVHHRQNRDILDRMSAFKLVKSFIYRNGLREYLFQLS
ncbi:MAG: hypothetical protein AB1640_12010 [bacterium]